MYLHLSFICLFSYSHFDNSISLLLKYFVGFCYPLQWETVRDERCGVYLALLDELQDFLAVTSIHTSRLESEILAVHLWQRQHLWLVIKGNNCHYCIGTGTLPSQLEWGLSTCHFQHSVCTSMVAVLHDEVGAFLWCRQQNIGVMRFNESPTFS